MNQWHLYVEKAPYMALFHVIEESIYPRGADR